ncbi:5-phosphohydroxy-L-lysine phospho-lyase-like isoform X1 [Tigriopus californicus]|uniref:5-phosphohydroxy-L-lysine phospho-lyase-like isoform X1 n=1 Tax=Tigriopus californicus TaxID=6832 RepID=UPI0027DA0445|nr:5-phosphohydroxy-L-lysine phospho-lyase-like isoform X1 [Tigriopus californicus]
MKDYILPQKLVPGQELASIGDRSRSVFLIQCRDGWVDKGMDLMLPHKNMQSDNGPECSLKNDSHGSTNKSRKPCHLMFEQNPLRIIRSLGSFMEDEDGQQLLDCVSGVCQVGHCHPMVLEAAQRASALAHISTDSNAHVISSVDIIVKDNYHYIPRLLATLPKNLNVGLVLHSGSEANDLALQLSKEFTGNHDVIVFESSFHGCLGTVSAISPKTYNNDFNPRDWVTIIPVPDLFRGQFRSSDPEALEKYFEQTKEIIQTKLNENRKFACLITEPIFTFHSLTIPEKSYMQRVVSYIRSLGALIIMDEVQTGLGRLGQNLWGFQNYEIVPDILVAGKPLGNGYPLAVLATSTEISRSLKDCHKYSRSQFVPSPMQSAIGCAVLDVVCQENLVANADEVGLFIRNSVCGLMTSHTTIGDVRGSGLLVGIELVQDMKTLKPAPKLAESVLYRLRQEGITVAVEGINNNVLILIPPLNFSKQEAGRFLQVFDQIVTELEKQMICQVSWGNELQRIGLKLDESDQSFLKWRSKDEQSGNLSGDSGQGSSISSYMRGMSCISFYGPGSPKDSDSDSGSSGLTAYNDLD